STRTRRGCGHRADAADRRRPESQALGPMDASPAAAGGTGRRRQRAPGRTTPGPLVGSGCQDACPVVLSQASPGFFTALLNQYRYALVLLDRWGCGSHEDAQSIARTVTRRLEQNGWQNRCGVVVADPEPEMWIWSPSPNVERILGWRGTPARMAEWLRAQGLLHGSKPDE